MHTGAVSPWSVSSDAIHNLNIARDLYNRLTISDNVRAGCIFETDYYDALGSNWRQGLSPSAKDLANNFSPLDPPEWKGHASNRGYCKIFSRADIQKFFQCKFSVSRAD